MATAFPAGNAGTAKLYNLKDLNTAIASTNFVVKAVSGFSGAMGTATPGVATVTAVPEVAGVDTVTFDVTEGNFVGGDTVTIDGKVLTFPAIYAGTNATDAAAQVKTLAEAVTALDDKYTITAAVGVLTFTEKAGKVDAVALTATTSNVYATVTAENTTLGTVEVTGVAGTNQIEKLTITKAASISAGEIVVTFNDGVQTLVKTVSIAGNEADADAVATKIAAAFGTELTNWDVTTSTADVVFTAKAKEANKTVKITVNEK